MMSVTVDEIAGTVLSIWRCSACGTASSRKRRRCPSCGADSIAADTIPAVGTVYAFTRTAEAAFLVAELAEGLRVLALAPSTAVLAIGDEVSLAAGDDGVIRAMP